MSQLSRRDFIATSAAALAVLSAPTFAAESKPKLGPICLFTKPLDERPVEEVIEIAAQAGFSALDISVRPKGLIEPAKVATDLPRAAELAKKSGLSIPMMVTALGDAKDPFAKDILKTAASVGVKVYRTNWFDYVAGAQPREQWAGFRSQLESLVALNREFGLCAAYQNHAGLRVGAGIWDLAEILQGLDPQFVGSQYDIRHATVEGSESWPNALRNIAPRIRSLAIKDFVRKEKTVESVPLGEGLVDFKKYFGLVKNLGISCPITLHVEYPVLTADEKKLPAADQRTRIVAALKHDREWLENALKTAGLV